ncbi:AvrD family protein [Vibrio ouci]|uniref:Avirulence D protein n=1 Tax=Vibrio ouci TaxID=2499078 RepID=A0A4Y8WBH5_9VIBR|nr:AvrD family protein [Vibrio ouci]TFH90262.1 hypothetical protein ELS82_17625 [Vibrio ouci]
MKTIESVEMYLGDPDRRFFGSGYKKVSYETIKEDVTVRKYSGIFNILYQEDWSLKKNKLPPHLSSIDTLILASRACESMMSSSGKTGYQISSLIVRASTSPLECLSSVSVSFQNQEELIKTIKIDGVVGNMKVLATYKKNNAKEDRFAFVDDWFKNSTQKIANITIADQDDSLSNLQKTTHGETNSELDYIDVFVSGLQVGQIMLYELDGIKREESNNLWMRSFKFEEREQYGDEGVLSVKLENITLTLVDGYQWRSADIVANVSNISLRCSVTHKLAVKPEMKHAS